jgi:biopolymer transport protein ExbB
VALTVALLAQERLARSIGGYVESGRAVGAGDNRLVDGTYCFVGPESFILSKDGGLWGTARVRESSEWPTVHAVRGWTAAEARGLFEKGPGVASLDASGGKALMLQVAEGSLFEHLKKGGTVGYVIIAIGLLALAISIQKFFDFRRLAVDEPPAVRRALGLIAGGAHVEAGKAIEGLKRTTLDLFTLGLQHRLKPKAILEEHLESYVMQQRMLQERRLPLLAVIATSGPLLGLLGTVTGMIKTFTLITVFGAGSAGKLSAGISEALVATKLGLSVAIPALVIHGFLSQRIQKQLGMLGRYAMEICTAAEESRQAPRSGPEVKP